MFEHCESPRVEVEPVEPYTLEEIRTILSAAQQRRNAARWAIALALGLRQGEVLCPRWGDVDLAQSLLRIRSTRTRPKYEHGCDGDCCRAPEWCLKRKLINAESGSTKSDAGRRIVGLPPVLVQLLAEHRSAQSRERQTARQLWNEGDWVFTSQTGRPLVPNSDYHQVEISEGGRCEGCSPA
jgi:integrase